MFDKTTGFVQHHLGHLDVPFGRFVEGGGDNLTLDGTLHVGHFFGALINEQHDDRGFRVVGGDAVGDLLEQYRLTREGRGHDKTTLALTDGGDEIHDTHADLILTHFQGKALIGVDGREAVEDNPLMGHIGGFVIDRLHLEEGEVTLAFFGGADVARDAVTGAEGELANLRGGDINVIGSGQIRVVRRAEETEAVRQDFQGAFPINGAGFFDASLKYREDKILFLEAAVLFDAEFFGGFVELGHGHGFEVGNI